MKKIIYMSKPFLVEQTLIVYEDGNKLDMQTIPMEKVNETLFYLMEKYSVNRVDLVGPKTYCKGLLNQISKLNSSKYNLTNLEINII